MRRGVYLNNIGPPRPPLPPLPDCLGENEKMKSKKHRNKNQMGKTRGGLRGDGVKGDFGSTRSLSLRPRTLFFVLGEERERKVPIRRTPYNTVIWPKRKRLPVRRPHCFVSGCELGSEKRTRQRIGKISPYNSKPLV